MIKNSMLESMRAGRPAMGMVLRQSRTVDIGRLMKAADFDFVMLDQEHNSMSLEQAVQIAVASQDAGVSPIMRVPKNDFSMACRALDNGVMGIIMPHIATAAEAAEFVRACRYPPVGQRSVSTLSPQSYFRGTSGSNIVAMVEPAVVLYALIESAEGAKNVDAIVATPGLDGILIGPQDLCLDLGIPGNSDDPKVQAIVGDCIAACKRHGKWIGLGGATGIGRRFANRDMNWLLVASDQALLLSAATERVKSLREQVK